MATTDKRQNDPGITINDIASSLGLSKTTVSRAISGNGRISDATRKKVLDYIQHNGYRPNLIAKGLATSKTYNIGMVLPADSYSAEMPFFQKCLMGASEMATAHDYDIVVITADPENTAQLERVLANRKVDAVILTRVWVNDPLVSILEQSGIPFLAIGSLHAPDVVQIDHDHRKASREITSLLLEQKMETIAFLGEDLESVSNLNRYQGYVDAFAAHGRKVQDDLVWLGAQPDEIQQAIDRLLKAKADCILCMDDFFCGNVLAILDSRHVRIPEEIRVASLYNSVYLMQHSPPISSVNFQVFELGSHACEILLDMLAGKEVPHKTLLDYEIRMEKSTL